MIKFICDLCGKETNNKDLREMEFAVLNANGVLTSYIPYDLCEDCRNELNEKVKECKYEFLKNKLNKKERNERK